MPSEQGQNVIEQLTSLGKRSEVLGDKLRQLVSSYENLTTSHEQYQALLREFGLEDEVRRSQKDVKRYKMVTLLYVVVYGFSELAQRQDASVQMDKFDEIILMIQDIAAKYHLVKIPSVGDNMLLAGGIEKDNKTNPIDATLAAIEILEMMQDLKRKDQSVIWEVGMGLHTGPVIGRFVQNKRTPYTLSGSNVLTATRLGFAAFRGHISMSPMTYELTKEFFDVRRCGKIPAKYSGVMDMFNLEGINEDLMNEDGGNKLYNEEFELNYQRLQFMDIQEHILDMLEEKLPKNLYYHNVKHTIDVTTEVELIGWAEGVPEKQILLLKVAGLFHDSGHIVKYKGHEEESCKIAQEILPQYNYSQEQIDEIKRIIMATQLPHTPNDILEAIIQDSDLDYLGRGDFIPVSNMLYKELVERNAANDIDKWNEMQIKFISEHQYYTKTAVSLREVNKQEQIERLKAQLGKGELLQL
ncbi:MAG: adenylate/guanylate cyclase domain-containing protein [Bacteroidia bacterium]|nr:adenylate/guanylate cyclase domain-containing protein [Bacteroidia bacterium]